MSRYAPGVRTTSEEPTALRGSPKSRLSPFPRIFPWHRFLLWPGRTADDFTRNEVARAGARARGIIGSNWS